MARLGIILAALFALAALAWMLFLPAVVEHELGIVTGCDVTVRVLSADPFTGRLVVRGLVARNPPGYPDPDFLLVNGLDASMDPLSLLGSQVVFDNLDLDVSKLEIIRLHDGRSNVSECSKRFSPAHAAGTAPSPAPSPRFLIKRLRIRLATLVIQDYSGSNPTKKSYPLKIDHTYASVTDARQLLVPDVVSTLFSFGLHRDVAQLLPGEFGSALATAIDGAAQVGSRVKGATQATGQFLKGLVDKLEQSAKP
jgi:hypothetical protein